MAEVAPTILASTSQDYEARLKRVKGFAKRIHVDISDGKFTDTVTVGLGEVSVEEGMTLDLHLMVSDPERAVAAVVELKPSLAIIHFEADGEHDEIIAALHEGGIKAGLAILPETSVDEVAELLGEIDHLLIFTGSLGHNGGQFKPQCLVKVAQARAINSELEIAVDGGVDDVTGAEAVTAGVDLLDCGSYIQAASDPEAAYRRLEALTGVAA
jgi:ribulose-phosphate 3-epimerase